MTWILNIDLNNDNVAGNIFRQLTGTVSSSKDVYNIITLNLLLILGRSVRAPSM